MGALEIQKNRGGGEGLCSCEDIVSRVHLSVTKIPGAYPSRSAHSGFILKAWSFEHQLFAPAFLSED